MCRDIACSRPWPCCWGTRCWPAFCTRLRWPVTPTAWPQASAVATTISSCGCSGWSEHAIAHGLGLFHPNLIFVPEGYNLARTTPIFTFGVILAPLTALAGPLVTYNVVMLAMPVLNAGTTYALCRRLGARRGPAFLGGFVFATAGIVAYSERGAPSTGCAVFVVVAIILVLNLIDPARTPRWRTAIWLGIDLAAQLYYASEMATTFLLFGVLALVITWLMDTSRRTAIRAAVPKLAVAAAVLVVAGLPYVLAFAFDRGTGLSHATRTYIQTICWRS